MNKINLNPIQHKKPEPEPFLIESWVDNQLALLEQYIGKRAPLINNDSSPLISREIESICTKKLEDKFSDFKTFIEAFLKYKIQETVNFIIRKDNTFKWKQEENLTLEDLARNLGYLYYYTDEIMGEPGQLIPDNPKLNKKENSRFEYLEQIGKLDDVRNAGFLVLALTSFFKEHYKLNKETSAISNLELNEQENATCSLEYKNILEKKYNDLSTEIKNIVKFRNKYYEFFRKMLDLETDVYTKCEQLLIYMGLFSERYTGDQLYELAYIDAIFDTIPDSAYDLFKLQIFFDVLNKIIRAPKNLKNLKILFETCNKCFQHFENNKKKAHICSSNGSTPISEEYLALKSYLNRLTTDLKITIEDLERAQLHQEMEEKKALFPQELSKQSNNKQQLGINNQSKKDQNNIQLLQETDNQLNEEEANILILPSKNEEIITNVFLPETAKEVEAKNQNSDASIITIQELKNIEISTQEEAVLPINLSADDNIEDIEREVNELFEAVRQLFEKDRKEKLTEKERKIKEAREQKLAAKKLEKSIDTPIIEKKMEIIKLDDEEQTILKRIFSFEDCHLKFSESEITKLIITLKGRVENGEKNKKNIIWGGLGNKHKSGEFEITHGKDKKGFLTGEYVKRIVASICDGVNRNNIEKDIIGNIIGLNILNEHLESFQKNFKKD